MRPLCNIGMTNRGNSEVLGPEDCEPIQIVTTMVAKDMTCVEGELIGIVLSAVVIPNNNVDCPCEPVDILPSIRGHIKWGLGCARPFTAVVDVRLGTQIGVVAESVEVCASYKVWRPRKKEHDGPCCNLPCYQVSAGLGYHVRGHNSNSSRLTKLAQIQKPGDKECIQIPPFALSFSVLPVNNGKCSLDVFGLCGGFRVHYDVVTPLMNLGQHNVESAFPLFNGARFIEVQNRNPQDPLDAFIIFGLAL